LTKETKQEHDFAGLIWFTRKISTPLCQGL